MYGSIEAGYSIIGLGIEKKIHAAAIAIVGRQVEAAE